MDKKVKPSEIADDILSALFRTILIAFLVTGAIIGGIVKK